MLRAHTSWWLFLTLLGIVGCEASLSDVAAPFRAGGNAKMAAIEKVGAQMAAAKGVTEPGPNDAALDFRASTLNAKTMHDEPNPNWNAVLAFDNECRELGGRKERHDLSVSNVAWLETATGILKDVPFDPGMEPKPDDAKWALDHLNRLVYLAVVKVTAYQKPKTGADPKSFVAGEAKGLVQVFELAGPKVLGGFTFTATNDQTLKYQFKTGATDVYKNAPEARRQKLAENLRENFYQQIWQGLAQRFPKAKLR